MIRKFVCIRLNYNICILRAIDNLYSYTYQENLNIGQLVIVNFRNKDEIGVIIDNQAPTFSGKIKSIISVLPYELPEKYVKFAQFVAKYNLANLGNILKFLVPFSIDQILRPEKIRKQTEIKTVQAVLNDEQTKAVFQMTKYKNSFKTILLQGLTGSGKTEVFLEFARQILDLGKQVLIMVPEIALSNELAQKVSIRLGIDCYIWHNSVSYSKKLAIWKDALNGKQICIVGARSSLYIPFKNLGCIIIDEEHDSSYKQTESVLYNARDMAVYLGSCFDIPVVLSSATPSIETYNNAKLGKYDFVKLTKRFYENAKLPEVYIDDIRKQELIGSLSSYSIDMVNKCLASGKQALIFVNRRGHSPKVLCKACGWKFSCPACSSWLCYHKENNEFLCHYCGFKTEVKSKCPDCGENSLIGLGFGVEKVSADCSMLFPQARIITLSSDTMNTPRKISKSLELIKTNQVDIVVGTQIISKGHNFDNLNLVIMTCADSMLYSDDFRAMEKAFQTIHQVSGRAGRRGNSNSLVIIQTYNPDEKLLRLIEQNDIDAIYSMELNNRLMMKMPPFGKIVSINLSSLDEKLIFDFCKKLIRIAPRNENIKILGPIRPMMYKIKSRYRLKIFIISNQSLQKYTKHWLSLIKLPRSISISVNIDPYSFI